jgi:GNAT superfamily N-acetyltransferase
MNSKRGLMTVLVGVAMLAMPLTAAAKDHGRFHNSQARVFTPAPTVAPVVVSKHAFRHGATWMPAPVVVGRHEWRGNHGRWNDGDADDYQGYGNRGYYAAPVYTAPVYAAPVYAAPAYQGYGYGGGQGCAQAQRVMRTYQRDRATGHPAAAADVLRQNQWALRSGCASGAPVGGLLGGLGGRGGYRGAPVYNNGGYNGGLLGGLGGYRGAPVYGNGQGYNAGYGQPYGNGSMLAPLLQYVR